MENCVLYDHIGSGYNSTRQADPLIAETLFNLLSPKKNKLYLDIGCGTGNYTIAIAEKGVQFYGIEPADEMLNIAREKSTTVKWLKGNAEHMPVTDNTFSGAVATLTIHHWANLKAAFNELHRVLKKNSRVIIFTALPAQMKGYWLNYYFPKMMQDAIVQMPSWQMIETAATEAGFAITRTYKYFISEELKDHFLYAGKHNPEIYLDEKIRKGISSFIALANSEEVQPGLSKLVNDINTGEFLAIKEEFNNNEGDYLYITLNKK